MTSVVGVARVLAAMLVCVLLQVVTVTTTTTTAHAVAAHRILITGDSITQGSSGDYTWRFRLWNKLATTAPGNVEFVGTRTDLFDNVNNVYGSQHYANPSFSARAHAARWGDTFIQELGQIGSQVASSNANVLVVALGSNDLAYHTNPSQTLANLSAYVNQARAARPGIDIVVSQVLTKWDPWANTMQLTTEANQYASLLQTYAAQTNTSAERVVIASTLSGWIPQDHTWDGTHPNPTGEKHIAQKISEALASLSIGTSSPSIAGQQAWSVLGPTPSVTSGSEYAALSWSRVSTGASGMYIEMRLTQATTVWSRLPFAISGDGWTVDVLAAGGIYQFRLVPSKGFLTGLPGVPVERSISGPQPQAISSVTPVSQGQTSSTGRYIDVSWSASSNATAYNLKMRSPIVGDEVFTDLPWPVTGQSWRFDYLSPGRHYEFKVQGNRGYLNGPTSNKTNTTRVNGLAGNRFLLALGDSYSAGTGASDMSGSCDRSPYAWAYLMQPDLQGFVGLAACSGDTRTDVPQQISEASVALGFRREMPRLVTLTIGGNDIGFSGLLKDCMLGNCTSQSGAKTAEIANLQYPLLGLYNSIKAEFPYADIIVGGYPNPIQVDGRSGTDPSCTALSNAERSMASTLTQQLNSNISTAANGAGVWNVGQGVRTMFNGHSACSVNGIQDWIHNVDWTITQGFLFTMNSFHPNNIGQSAYSIVFGNKITDMAN